MIDDGDQPTLFGDPVPVALTGMFAHNVVTWLESHGWTCHRPGESCVEVTHAFTGKRDTSADAALAVEPKTGTQRARVLRALRKHGPMTDPELVIWLNMGPNTERPRRVELVTGGLVRDSGERRTHHGRDHIAWEAVPTEERTP